MIRSPIWSFRRERIPARELVGPSEFLEIVVDAPIEECRRRDPAGLYARAFAGPIPNFIKIFPPYEAPDAPDLQLRTAVHDVETLVGQGLDEVRRRSVIASGA